MDGKRSNSNYVSKAASVEVFRKKNFMKLKFVKINAF